MTITKEQLEARKAQLQEQRAQLESQHLQILANLNAHEGAIQDCDHWLAELDKPEAETK